MELRSVKSVRPTFNRLVTTCDLYAEDMTRNGLIVPKEARGTLKEYQTVIAVGDTVRNVQVGDLVHINPMRYSRMRHDEGSLKNGVVTDNPVVDYDLPVLELDGKRCLLLYDQDIDYVVTGYEAD